MAHLDKDLTLLVLQYFNEENLKEAARTLGHESGLYFDLKYFEDIVLEGKWDETENYLSAFTKVMDNKFSIKMYFELRKQKYFEALEVNDHHKALDILLKDLKVFANGNEALFKDLSYFLIVDNIRNLKPSYGDVNSARKDLMWLQNPNQEPDLLMDYCNSEASTSAPKNSGTTMEWKPSTNGRPINMDLDERNLFEICTPSQCQFLKLPMHPEATKILRLAYCNMGDSIVALASNGIHLVWRWPRNGFNLDGKASAQFCSQLWHPKDGPQFMINELLSIKCVNPASCFAYSNGYIISTSGGMVSLFNTVTFKTLTTIMSPPPMVTSLAYYPKDNNIFGIGFDDSTILIYHVRQAEVLFKLEGHSTRVTAIAFSYSSNILVSGDANAQIILWNTDGWKKLKDKQLQIQGNQVSVCETQIQFHPDQINFLVVHRSHLAIYEATELKCVNQWLPEVPILISQATFSSDGHTVYSIFGDGAVAIFDASNFEIRCRVYRSCYLPTISRWGVYPISVAAHPQKPAQFAVGLSDGSVYVFEPQMPGGDWIKNH
ncbi:hypothetical protein JHK82_048415 [Glycine max]|nr:hypothetical protein JHK86_048273 [Glycine max]KAG5098561.1 hypothetical protein JHK82_048415 [Glycine max]